jgi:hypothetical protein
MRFVIADIDGRSQAYFDTRDEARDALLEMEAEDAAALEDLYVIAYDDNGERVWGPETAAQVLYMTPIDWSQGVLAASASGKTLNSSEGITKTIRRVPSRLVVGAGK